MKITRRHALIGLVSLTAVSAVSLVKKKFDRFSAPATQNRKKRAYTLALLHLAVQIVIDVKVETSHYDSYFSWRYDQIPGAAKFYAAFAHATTAAAQKFGSSNILDCTQVEQQQIMRQLVVDGPQNSPGAIIRAEILQVFCMTDAWLLLNYGSSPGTPRGLTAYLSAPATHL